VPSKKATEAKSAKTQEILKLILNSETYSPPAALDIVRHLQQGISDEEWSKLQRYSEFPDKARFEFPKLIQFYWKWRCQEWIPQATQQKVKAVRNMAVELMRELKELSNDDNFYKGIFAEYKRSSSEYEAELERARDNLSKLESALLDAEFRLVDGVSRASYGPAYAVIRSLDALAHGYGDHPISLSKKNPCGMNFVLEFFGMLDVQIKSSYVITILKAYLAQRESWGGIQNMVRQNRD
jgi:hypothetical protein